MKNRYIKRAHISERQFRVLLKYFCEDFTITQTSNLTNISRVTAERLYQEIRLRIFELSKVNRKIDGEIEIDESYFGRKRIRGKRGRGAGEKIPVIGLLKREGKVYTRVIRNCSRRELLPIIRGKILEGSTIYTDGWRSYEGLVLNGYKHHRIRHHKDEFARGRNHINCIESFWSYTKRRLRKFNGIQKDKFLLHLKESEFRWNYRRDNIYKILLKNFRENPL